MDIAYIAGLIDADGTVTASLVNQDASRTKSSTFQPCVQITMQNLSVLIEVMETLKCGDIRAYLGGYSGCYRYDVPTKDMVRVLPLLIPHLRVKKEQAKLVLKGLATRCSGSHNVGPETRKLRRSIVEEIQFLNARDAKEFKSNWVKSVKTSSFVTKYEATPSQAPEGEGSGEGVTTSRVSPNNNPDQERPTRKGRDSLTSTVM